MRRVFTIGITNDGEAVLLKDHRSELREHKAGLKTVVGEFQEVFILETSRRTQKHRVGATGGNVNAKASLLVSEQKGKGVTARAEEHLGIRNNGASEGKVNNAASMLVSEQRGEKRLAPRRRRRIVSAAKKTIAKKSPALPPAPADEGRFASDAPPPSLP